jgi:protein-S-isoprenylcysteine O-methyltransferase Ste14
MFQWFAFIWLSVVLILVSRTSLRVPGSHGFYRFFAWECILALILLNITGWFQSPLAWYQLISWALLIVSLVPLYFGVRTLIDRGKPIAQRNEEPQLFTFERTSALVTTGIYRTIRHPLYSSLLLLTWGVFFKAPGWIGCLLALATSVFLYLTAIADEAECLHFFGEEYQNYMSKTKRFVPYII